MARQGISEEQVFAAAGALMEEGTTPTVQALRERIGSGSYSTINRHLGAWREAHAAETPAALPEIPEKVLGAFRQVWAVAARAAQGEVETQRQALEAMRREMEKEKAEMGAEIERLEATLETAGRRTEELEKALEAERKGRVEVEEQATALRIENARLDERVKAAEGRAGELKDQLARLESRFAEAVKSMAGGKGRTGGRSAPPNGA